MVYNVPISVIVAEPPPASIVEAADWLRMMGFPPRVYVPVAVPLKTGLEIFGVVIVGEVIVGVPASVYVPVAEPLSTGFEIAGEVIVGVPPNVYVPVAVPLNVGFEMAGLVMVGVPASVYVPVTLPLNVGVVNVAFVKLAPDILDPEDKVTTPFVLQEIASTGDALNGPATIFSVLSGPATIA